MSLGATYLRDGHCRFQVWAPLAQGVSVHQVSPQERLLPLLPEERGYYQAVIDGVGPGSLYFYRLDGKKERPDPASRYQPQDVHGPSQVVDSSFQWEDSCWSGLPLRDYIIYELHVGTFTPEGTFEAIIPHLDGLKNLGITAVELMPIAQFPGSRNWGYDGVYPFAVHHDYGGPEGLKRLVNACHRHGLAAVLDVVYNHLGPEGNYFGDFGPYFTQRYHTPWGSALNFDGPYSDEVRRFFIENALYWVTEFHMDALRLDAVHAILDHSAQPFLQELAATVQGEAERLNRRVYLFGESHDNDARLVRPLELGGYGLDALWNDDFHHAIHALLTGERNGYYEDFGQVQHLAKGFKEGFVYSGQYAPFWQRRRGTPCRDIPAHRFVVCAQNHDQVGNRVRSERLSQLVSFEGLKLSAGLVLLSPFVPLLFMGEEYGEKAPFRYFISHSDPALVEAVRRGRRAEFAAFQWQGKPADPYHEETFRGSKLNRRLLEEGHHRVLLRFYQELIRLRKELPALANLSKEHQHVAGCEEERALFFRRWSDKSEAWAAFNLGDTQASVVLPVPRGCWRKRLDSADEEWKGGGSAVPHVLSSEGEAQLTLSPKAVALFVKEEHP